ncbi:hypothetical protein E2C01_017263 [Portunus trituberculatus]|uniref:Uncharacterized protein n=1 Tax=Portunus trituberculatus TaxID=210409 RepID=A0A5B7DSV7_PORTR|nr:hypothetical protein [Portunus trituberculatus]
MSGHRGKNFETAQNFQLTGRQLSNSVAIGEYWGEMDDRCERYGAIVAPSHHGAMQFANESVVGGSSGVHRPCCAETSVSSFHVGAAVPQEHILSLYPFVEISILVDFKVHQQLWLSFPYTDHPGELAFNFAILHDLEQLVQHPTHIPDRLGDAPNILDFFLTP